MLYLIRHTDALDALEDAERPLSPKGCKQAAKLARFLRESGEFKPAEFWHSSLVRARETAELLAEGTGSKAVLKEVSNLKPDSDPSKIVERLPVGDRSIAIVGHDPHLTLLGTLLVTGSIEPAAFIMRKGAILGLVHSPGSGPRKWVVAWHLFADLLG